MRACGQIFLDDLSMICWSLVHESKFQNQTIFDEVRILCIMDVVSDCRFLQCAVVINVSQKNLKESVMVMCSVLMEMMV